MASPSDSNQGRRSPTAMASPSVSDQERQSPTTQSPTSNGDGESSQDSALDLKIKDEPADLGYEQPASNENHSNSNSRTSTPPLSVQRETASPSQDADGPTSPQSNNHPAPPNDVSASSTIRSHFQGTSNSGKKVDSVQNIVEGLLKKNATLLAMSDTENLKPNSRRKGPENYARRGDGIQTAVGQSTIFPVSMVSQARLVASPGNSDRKRNDANRSRLLRPKSPTRKCDTVLRDDTQLSYALMEANVGDQEVENVFRVQHHELVCAVSLKPYITDKDSVVAVLDKSYYWCNFCSFSSTNKELLTQHVMDHRFRCNHCPYESFCRSDIFRHMATSHTEFSSSAHSLSYCTFLSDYLRVKSRSEKLEKKMSCVDPDEDVDDLDKDEMEAAVIRAEKRKKEDDAERNRIPEKRARLEDTIKSLESSDSIHADRQGKSRKSLNPRRYPQPSENDYDTFEMEVEEINDFAENGSEDGDKMKVMYPSQMTEHTEHNKPVSTSVVPRMQVVPSLQEGGKQGFTTTHISSPVPASQPGRPSKAPCPFNKTKRTSGSSSLYWSCGYCDFQSNSQAEIKEHSNRNHPGNPHRYVALIKNMTPDSIINKNVGKHNTSNYRSNPAPNSSNDPVRNKGRNSQQGTFSSVKLDTVSNNGNDRRSTFDEVVPLKEDNDPSNLLKVKFNPTRVSRKETTIYRCYHCPYTAKRHSAMKSHIYYKHRGKGLLAVDDESSTGEKVFFCARDDCTFKSVSPEIYLSHVDQCTPWHKPELADVEVEPHIRECLQQTVTFAELSRDKI